MAGLVPLAGIIARPLLARAATAVMGKVGMSLGRGAVGAAEGAASGKAAGGGLGQVLNVAKQVMPGAMPMPSLGSSGAPPDPNSAVNSVLNGDQFA